MAAEDTPDEGGAEWSSDAGRDQGGPLFMPEDIEKMNADDLNILIASQEMSQTAVINAFPLAKPPVPKEEDKETTMQLVKDYVSSGRSDHEFLNRLYSSMAQFRSPLSPAFVILAKLIIEGEMEVQYQLPSAQNPKDQIV